MKRLLLCLLVAGCASADARKAQTDLIGRSKADILSCLGAPSQKAAADGIEVWSYRRDAGSVGTVISGNVYTSRRQCKANFIFRGSRVARITYSGRGNTCGRLVQPCL